MWDTVASIHTVSRHDIYDYLRCPKIVALKTYKSSIKPASKPRPKPERSLSHEIGTIGEVLTQRVLSGKTEEEVLAEFEHGTEPQEVDRHADIEEKDEFLDASTLPEELVKKRVVPPLKADLRNRGVRLDSHMKDVLQETVTGLGKIKKYLDDEYGKVQIFGHGESRNGLLPNRIMPDFVATVEDKKTPILIEVKNTENINSKTNQFQASFYNTVGRRFGITVIEERLESRLKTIVPQTVNKRISETLLIYPRQGKFERITDEVRIDKKIVDGVWQAKQLGLKGRSPKTDCGSSCPHHRHGKLPEGNLETAIPLSLIYSKGRLEQKADLDIEYLKRFLARKGITGIINSGLWDINNARFNVRFRTLDQDQKQRNYEILDKQEQKYITDMATKLGFSKKVMERIISWDYENSAQTSKKLEREMANELEPWKKLLGAKKFKLSKRTAKANATRIYSLPSKSKKFVTDSWNAWD